MKNYFSLDENFNKIIKETLSDKNIEDINSVSTGWTNIVFEAKTDDGNYYFRFPRDDFWLRTIEKDCEFSNFIDGKTVFNTVKLNLQKDDQRPFSVHKKIDGITLAEKINTLSEDEIKVVSKDISEFMYQLHNADFERNGVFKTDKIGVNLVDFLDELIELHISDDNKKFWRYNDFVKKDNNCLVHGDLNLSNILIDQNNHISGVIDFGFAGFGNKYFDIARILSRDCPKNFKNEIIDNYEKISNEKLDLDILDKEIKLWQDIDNGYIKYMRKIGIYE